MRKHLGWQMKNYILIFGITDIVAGGPIYDCNKKKYMEEHGWRVIVVPVSPGKVLLTPLREYEGISFPFITLPPSLFTTKQREEKIELLATYVDVNESDRTIIETGTDYTALWGELLAKRLNAKHFVMFLDETNNRVNTNTFEFYRFKYERNELASISLNSLNAIFSPYFKLPFAEQHVLSAWCSNSIGGENIDIEKEIPDGDYIIGSIGRLEKGFVPNIITGICEFAKRVPNKKVVVCFIGGTNKKTEERIRSLFKQKENISLYITGYLWPIPQNIFSKFDLFISGAGSARVSAEMGIPTVKMDAITYEPLGFVEDLKSESMKQQKLENGTVENYIWKALIEKDTPLIKGRTTIDEKWNVISRDFDKHMDFIESSIKEKEYYQTDKLDVGIPSEKLKKLVLRTLGWDVFYKLNKVWVKIRLKIKR